MGSNKKYLLLPKDRGSGKEDKMNNDIFDVLADNGLSLDGLVVALFFIACIYVVIHTIKDEEVNDLIKEVISILSKRALFYIGEIIIYIIVFIKSLAFKKPRFNIIKAHRRAIKWVHLYKELYYDGSDDDVDVDKFYEDYDD